MLFAIEPAALVASTIRPFEDTLALFLVVDVFASVNTVVFKSEHSKAVHHVVSPVTRILATVSPNIGSCSLHFVVHKVSLKS